MDFKDILEKLSFSENLSLTEAETALNMIMSGEVEPEQIASFLTAMRMKGETVEELTAFVKVMREKSVKVNVNVKDAVDLVGTGGDKSGTFNISTAAAFITASAGVPVVKHGNRSASSKCGSADVLEKIGACVDLEKEGVEQVYKEIGMTFMFAPKFHPAMRFVMPARRSLGFRTFFNILGPMVNPAGVKRYVIGAYNKEVARKMIQILANLDTDFAYTFSAHDGLDEVSLTAQTDIFELREKLASTPFRFDPEFLGYQKVKMKLLLGNGPDENAEILKNILTNKGTEAQTNIALLNAAFAIHASGKVRKLEEAKEMATEALKSGETAKKLRDFIDATSDAMGTFKF